jgi:hypothetical protein
MRSSGPNMRLCIIAKGRSPMIRDPGPVCSLGRRGLYTESSISGIIPHCAISLGGGAGCSSSPLIPSRRLLANQAVAVTKAPGGTVAPLSNGAEVLRRN